MAKAARGGMCYTGPALEATCMMLTCCEPDASDPWWLNAESVSVGVRCERVKMYGTDALSSRPPG